MTVKNKVQALLFSSGKYMLEEDIIQLSGESKAVVKKALKELKEFYEKSDDAIAILEANGLWKMGVKNEYLPLVRSIVADTELDTPVLETLAVVAWKRPILQSEIIEMRGSHAYDHIRQLLELGFITRDKHGRTYKVKLAPKFFEYFDVEGDKDIRELFANVQKPEPKKIGKLEVVDLKKEQEQDIAAGKLGELEIVDPLEKWKVDHVELDEFDKQIKQISERTQKHMDEIDKYKPEEPEEEDVSSEMPEVQPNNEDSSEKRDN